MDESTDPYNRSDRDGDAMGGTWSEGGDNDRSKFHDETAWTQQVMTIFTDLENLVRTQGWPFLDHPNARVTFLRLFTAM
jgi:hypothetical protein